MELIKRFKGCMIGGAVGDALGYTIEFNNYNEIIKMYGDNGITKQRLINGKALISDDTQMSLFTATGLLLGTTRRLTRGVFSGFEQYIYKNYLDWYNTQRYINNRDDIEKYSWLSNIEGLRKRRAPGNTCLDALSSGICGRIDDPINNSKGCGGVMRVAPIGLYFANPHQKINAKQPEKIIGDIAAKASAITHGHELGYIPSYMLAVLIYKLCKEQNIEQAVKESLELTVKEYENAIYINDFKELIVKSILLSKKDFKDIDAINILGKGWVAEETLAIAIYCALKYQNDFEQAVIASVNHSGDSDSTGAVLGNILGAYLGIDNIPKHFYENLELIEVIEEVTKDLFNDCHLKNLMGEVSPEWEMKYITKNYTIE